MKSLRNMLLKQWDFIKCLKVRAKHAYEKSIAYNTDGAQGGTSGTYR